MMTIEQIPSRVFAYIFSSQSTWNVGHARRRQLKLRSENEFPRNWDEPWNVGAVCWLKIAIGGRRFEEIIREIAWRWGPRWTWTVSCGNWSVLRNGAQHSQSSFRVLSDDSFAFFSHYSNLSEWKWTINCCEYKCVGVGIAPRRKKDVIALFYCANKIISPPPPTPQWLLIEIRRKDGNLGLRSGYERQVFYSALMLSKLRDDKEFRIRMNCIKIYHEH